MIISNENKSTTKTTEHLVVTVFLIVVKRPKLQNTAGIFQFGEKCGGFGNAEGVCAGGLGCLIKYQPGVESEQNKTGECVTEQREECSNPRSGVSCRPGQLGVPSDFVFCPQQCRTGANRNTGGNTGFLFGKI